MYKCGCLGRDGGMVMSGMEGDDHQWYVLRWIRSWVPQLQTIVKLIEVRTYEPNVYSPEKAMTSKSHQSIFTDFTLSVETNN